MNLVVGLVAIVLGMALIIWRERFVNSVEKWAEAHWGRWYPGRTPGGRWVVAAIGIFWIILGAAFAVSN